MIFPLPLPASLFLSPLPPVIQIVSLNRLKFSHLSLDTSEFRKFTEFSDNCVLSSDDVYESWCHYACEYNVDCKRKVTVTLILNDNVACVCLMRRVFNWLISFFACFLTCSLTCSRHIVPASPWRSR